MSTPAYHRAWRMAHRDAERARKARYRATEAGRRSRAREYARRRSRAAPPLPALHTGHPLLEAACALVPAPAPGARLAWREELLAQDLRSEAVLAQLEGRDPVAAVRAYRAREGAWAALAVPLRAG